MKFILHATREMRESAYLRSNSEPDIANDLFRRFEVVGCTPYCDEVIVVIQKNLGVGADIGCVYQVLQFSSPDFKEMSHTAKVPSGYYIQNKRVSVTMDGCLLLIFNALNTCIVDVETKYFRHEEELPSSCLYQVFNKEVICIDKRLNDDDVQV